MSEKSIMAQLSEYISTAGGKDLPDRVVEKAKHHILDTIAAMVSGARLKPGELAIKFVRSQGGTPEAQVIGADFLSTAINAAMANGIMGHADETDDTHSPSLSHPGCAIVPAALAMAERENASGEAFLKAVVLGYEICTRIGRVMGTGAGRVHGHSTHAIAPLFGATAASASLAGLNARQVRYAMAYAAQQSSGITTWPRDEEHVEKAFVFGGIGARNGVTSVLFVQQGFTGEDDIFSGDDNFLELFCPGRAELPGWVANLGTDYDILLTAIKKFCVGAPIQAAAEAMSLLVKEHRLTRDKVKKISVHLPPQGSRVVNNRTMPDINCQYVMACILLDGQLTFKAAHSYERMSDPVVREVQARVELIGDPQFAQQERERPALVRIQLSDGQVLEKHIPAVRGSAANPMNRDEVEAKCSELLQEVLGKERTGSLIQNIWGLEKIKTMRELRPLLSA